MEKKWWHKSVVYHIYPKSFYDSNHDGVGDINGIINKLDYIKEIGVDVIWLSPVYQSPMKDNGYDIANYYEIDPIFGTLEDMDRLIEEVKKRDMKIIMDLVVNHTSDKHPWFLESRKSKDNPYRDYYIWRDEPNDLKSSFGGSAWAYDELTNQYYFRRYAKEQPDLNWSNPKVRHEIYQMMNWWLKRGISGFRMDVIDKIGKDVDNHIVANGPKLHAYLKEMNQNTFGNHDVITVGETSSADVAIAEEYTLPERQEINMVFHFEHMRIDFGKYKGFSPIELDFLKLKQILSRWQTEYRGWNALYWNNHDQPRIVSRFGHENEYRVESAKMLAIILHLMKGTPYIYQGEELGMTNVSFQNLEDYDDVAVFNNYDILVKEEKVLSHDEFIQAVYKMSRDNGRTPMQWDDTIHAGFSTKTPWLGVNPNHLEINVSKALEDKDSIFYTYQKLIQLRRNSKYSDTIIYGDYELLLEEDPQVFAYKRIGKDAVLLIVANFYQDETIVSLNGVVKKVILSNYGQPETNLRHLRLRPYEAIVYLIEK